MSTDVLAVGAHPDDVELGCGGTLAALSSAGYGVAIVHLTAGEAGTRGTAETRRSEAEAAAAVIGASLHWLDFGDGGLRRGDREEDELIALLRQLTPQVVLSPPPRDRHPDHERAHALTKDACFYAGVGARGQGRPHRPQAVWSYMIHHPFEPRFIVDVTRAWDAKCRAMDAYASQLYNSKKPVEGPPTRVSSPGFRASVEGRARHYGELVGAEFGEPFFGEIPPGVTASSLLGGPA